MSLSLKEIFTYSILIIFQIKFSFLMELYGIKPNLIIIYLILNNLKKELPMQGIILGFSIGFLIDLISGNLLGVSSLTYSMVGFFSAIVGRETEKMTKTNIFVTALSLITFHSFIFYIFKLYDLSLLKIFLGYIFPSIAYTILIEVIYIYFFPFKKKRLSL